MSDEGNPLRFDLRRPCKNCPFRRDCVKGWLGKHRAEEIADSLLSDNRTFPCHKTTKFGDDGETVPHEGQQMCVGARLLVEKEGAPNMLLQIAERLDLLDPSITAPEASDLTFNSRSEFVAHHGARR